MELKSVKLIEHNLKKRRQVHFGKYTGLQNAPLMNVLFLSSIKTHQVTTKSQRYFHQSDFVNCSLG